MPNAPDDPGMRRWLPRQPLEADRLDRWQSKTVMDVTVTGGGAKSIRKGNRVAVHFPRQRPRPVSAGAFPIVILGSELAHGYYQAQRLDMTKGVPISRSQSIITEANIGERDPEILQYVNLPEVGHATGLPDLVTVGQGNIHVYSAQWHPVRSVDGRRVCWGQGWDWFQCAAGLNFGDLGAV